MNKFNVYLINTDTFMAERLIASNVSMVEADRIERNEQRKHDALDYYVAGYEVGTSADLKASEELEENYD